MDSEHPNRIEIVRFAGSQNERLTNINLKMRQLSLQGRKVLSEVLMLFRSHRYVRGIAAFGKALKLEI
jgi:hypothetical protein